MSLCGGSDRSRGHHGGLENRGKLRPIGLYLRGQRHRPPLFLGRHAGYEVAQIRHEGYRLAALRIRVVEQPLEALIQRTRIIQSGQPPGASPVQQPPRPQFLEPEAPLAQCPLWPQVEHSPDLFDLSSSRSRHGSGTTLLSLSIPELHSKNHPEWLLGQRGSLSDRCSSRDYDGPVAGPAQLALLSHEGGPDRDDHPHGIVSQR